MIHSSYFKPRVFPVFGNSTACEIDRLQELTASNTLNRTKILEIGRDGIVDWRKSTPSVQVSLKQLEYGSVEFWTKLANKTDATTKVEFSDFKTPAVDVAGYKTDDAGTFLGTVWYPNLRVTSFSMNVGDPDAMLERSFSLVGEDEITLLNANKYLIQKTGTIVVSGENKTVSLSDPTPVLDPDNSGKYLFKVVKIPISGAAAYELVYTTGYTYTAGTLTIVESSTAGDIIVAYYSAGAYIAGQDPFVNNDTDLAGITADSVSVYLESSNYVYRLQSAGLEVSFDRQDVKEIGNKDVVGRGVKNVTARVTLGRILEAYTIEEILRGKAGLSYGKLDPRRYGDNFSLVVKLYSDNTKTTFKLGYKISDLAAVSMEGGAPLNDYVTRGTTLEGQTGFVTSVEGDLSA